MTDGIHMICARNLDDPNLSRIRESASASALFASNLRASVSIGVSQRFSFPSESVLTQSEPSRAGTYQRRSRRVGDN